MSRGKKHPLSNAPRAANQLPKNLTQDLLSWNDQKFKDFTDNLLAEMPKIIKQDIEQVLAGQKSDYIDVTRDSNDWLDSPLHNSKALPDIDGDIHYPATTFKNLFIMAYGIKDKDLIDQCLNKAIAHQTKHVKLYEDALNDPTSETALKIMAAYQRDPDSFKRFDYDLNTAKKDLTELLKEKQTGEGWNSAVYGPSTLGMYYTYYLRKRVQEILENDLTNSQFKNVKYLVPKVYYHHFVRDDESADEEIELPSHDAMVHAQKILRASKFLPEIKADREWMNELYRISNWDLLVANKSRLQGLDADLILDYQRLDNNQILKYIPMQTPQNLHHVKQQLHTIAKNEYRNPVPFYSREIALTTDDAVFADFVDEYQDSPYWRGTSIEVFQESPEAEIKIFARATLSAKILGDEINSYKDSAINITVQVVTMVPKDTILTDVKKLACNQEAFDAISFEDAVIVEPVLEGVGHMPDGRETGLLTTETELLRKRQVSEKLKDAATNKPITFEQLLGSRPACSHQHAKWVDTYDALRLDCPSCYRQAVKVIPYHQLDKEQLAKFGFKIDGAYLKREIGHRILAGKNENITVADLKAAPKLTLDDKQ